MAAAALLFVFSPLRCVAQEIQKIGEFSTMNGTVQLLPTGNVLEREEGKTTLYSYQSGSYVPNGGVQVAPQVLNWIYFDWQSIDWGDQRDKNGTSIPSGEFWPKDARVKKVIYLSAPNATVVKVLVCYTMSDPTESSPLASSKLVKLVAIRGTLTDRGYVYHSLWTKTLRKDSSYGDLVVQQVPEVGRLLVLYSGSLGSAEIEDLTLYELRDTN